MPHLSSISLVNSESTYSDIHCFRRSLTTNAVKLGISDPRPDPSDGEPAARCAEIIVPLALSMSLLKLSSFPLVMYALFLRVSRTLAYVLGRPTPSLSSSLTKVASLKRGGGDVACR